MRLRLVDRSSVICVALTLGVAAFGPGCSSDKPTSDGGSAAGGSGGGAGGTAGSADGGGAGGAAGSADGGGAGGASGDASADASAATINVMSTALTEGGTFASANTCAGVNTSPPLTWTAGPAGTMSYAVVLTDLSINAVHWAIWDLPSNVNALPAALPGDTTITTPVSARQIHKTEFFGAGGAYRGPCPSGNNHNYQFEVSAIPSATLALSAPFTVEQVKAAIVAAATAHGDLTGMSNASAPPADASGQ